jgi:acylphosphatase
MTDQASPKKTLHLAIRGRVQGVFYRNSMQREAQLLSVCGWVRNCGDGSVEAVVQGNPAAVDAIVRWAQRGPERARVEQVDATPAQGEFANFEITG